MEDKKMAAVKKTKIQWAISLLLVMLYFSGLTAQAQYGGGSGATRDPYLIYTTEQMNAIGANPIDWEKHFKLMADIDLGAFKGTDSNIIGYWVTWQDRKHFTGVFDGNGHTISNFSYISTDTDYVGLFGYVDGKNAQIKDLGLIDPNVDAETRHYVGSLVGYLKDGTISNCYAEGGGVVGKNCVGGLVGWNEEAITNCYSTGVVSGDEDVGGLVGRNGGSITTSYNTGTVSGNNDVGGLVGFSNDGTITNCYSTGGVSGNWDVGGLVGVNYKGSITISYSTSMVSGGNVVGGLVGSNKYRSDITQCYSAGAVSGEDNIGGLVGRNRLDSTVSTCFWDIETSGLTNMCGTQSDNDVGCDDSYGKNTTEMQTASMFLEANWDFVDEQENGREDIWRILEGRDYPRLVRKLSAFSPYPQDGATDVIQLLTLHWSPGVSTMCHDVYFGEDEEVVKNATTGSPEYIGSRQLGSESYDPGKLELDTTYYWRIDEVNEADPNNPQKGKVWSFTTAKFLIVDDFESYNGFSLLPGESNWIFETWIDGYDDPTNGSLVGYENPPFVGTIVHSGVQSMPFYYDNSVGYSEATANVDNLEIDQDWTIEGVGVLSLWFYGAPNNAAESMYVALNGSTVVYYDNPDALLIEDWTDWRIDLQAFADQGVNLANVNTITLGLGNKNNPQAGGSGQMWFDDIRLYRPEPEQEPRTSGGF